MATATSLIQTLKTETREGSVTPARLAEILEAVLAEGGSSSAEIPADLSQRLDAIQASVAAAMTAATSAQTTAEAAKTAATSAQTTAEAAKTKAEQAMAAGGSGAELNAEFEQRLTSLQTNLGTVQTTAETAQTTANAAKTAAEAAKTTANAAKTTAEAAKTAADQAAEGGQKHWFGTADQYAALTTIDPETIYMITE
ncbi:MAG: alanine-zipper protein [Muribaculaceae bacterium]|nr:alanine-zipper protein [Muribaculaceae bacterium]